MKNYKKIKNFYKENVINFYFRLVSLINIIYDKRHLNRQLISFTN